MALDCELDGTECVFGCAWQCETCLLQFGQVATRSDFAEWRDSCSANPGKSSGPSHQCIANLVNVQHNAHVMSNILHRQAPSPDDVLGHLSTNLKRLRHERQQSQAQLAARAGLSRRMLSAIEGGAANVSLSTVDKLAAALGVKFTDMVRSPADPDALHIESVGWRGRMEGSEGILLGAAPGTRESELWRWSLAPGERYPSEAGSENWHEMLYGIEGSLLIETATGHLKIEPGDFQIFSSRVPYTFVNATSLRVCFIRTIVL
jgi:transcriptional regulator with XRE-family HTH domain